VAQGDNLARFETTDRAHLTTFRHATPGTSVHPASSKETRESRRGSVGTTIRRVGRTAFVVAAGAREPSGENRVRAFAVRSSTIIDDIRTGSSLQRMPIALTASGSPARDNSFT
jgi:hypothetical protein